MADNTRAPGNIGVRQVEGGRDVGGIWLGPELTSDFIQYVGSMQGLSLFAKDASNRIEYIGTLKPGGLVTEPVAQIVKFFYDAEGVITRIAHAGGDPSYVHIWNDRTSLTYPDGT